MTDDSGVETEAASHRDLLTPAQLADRWHVSTGHLANLRHQGEGIGYLKIGNRVAYRYRDVMDYEDKHYVSTAPAIERPTGTA